jgi:signal transduction histidine kinase/CheY-like chemotaxis protein
MPDNTILIVDDDRTVIRLCQHILHRAGYQTLEAMDATSALHILERQKVDLLLSDIRMPVIDGFELVARAKKLVPGLPVLAMTGFGSVENAIQALHRGVDGLLLKPFENTSELVEAVQSVLEESRQRSDAARLRVLRPLLDVNQQLFTEPSPQALETLIIHTICQLFQAEYTGIYLFVADGGARKLDRAMESEPLNIPAQLRDMDFYSIYKQFVMNDEPFIYSAPEPLDPGSGLILIREMGFQSMMVAPVLWSNTHIVLVTGRKIGGERFTTADLEMFIIFARQSVVALENARLYSELNENMRRVEESHRALVQAEKMAAVGRLVASLAHEINNPLQAVRNCLHLASRHAQLNPQCQHYLDLSEGELDRLSGTVRRMLDFYRPGGVEAETIHIQQILEKVLALIDPQLREQGIQVHFTVTGEKAPVLAVSNQIQQVIFNLLMNSMDAMEESTLQFTDEITKQIWVDLERDEKNVILRIEDSGHGLSEEIKGHLFEPFVSTKRHGTGLGLAVSYEIIERHQGRLSVIPSRHGEGACFELTLPAKVEVEDVQDIAR